MQDRVSTYPGRVTLTPVTGQENTYDMVRADSPTVAGTPLDKSTFLTDAVATAVGNLTGTTPSVPSEAIGAIASALSTMGITNVGHLESGSYTGTGTSSTSSWLSISFSITPKFVLIVAANGNTGQPSDTTILSWVNGQTQGRTSSSGYVEWSVSNKNLRRRNHSNLSAAQLMNTSGTTYYYVGVGLK